MNEDSVYVYLIGQIIEVGQSELQRTRIVEIRLLERSTILLEGVE